VAADDYSQTFANSPAQSEKPHGAASQSCANATAFSCETVRDHKCCVPAREQRPRCLLSSIPRANDHDVTLAQVLKIFSASSTATEPTDTCRAGCWLCSGGVLATLKARLKSFD